MKKFFLVLITVIFLSCIVGCREDGAYDNIAVYNIINKHDDGPMKIIEYDNLQVRYVDGWQNWEKIYELIDLNYIDESEVVELGLDPSYYLKDNLKLMYRIYQYNYLYYTPETIDIYEDGTVVISYQVKEVINDMWVTKSCKYISVNNVDLNIMKSLIDKHDNIIIEIDKEDVEMISVYPFINSINTVTNTNKIDSLIEQFYGVVCDKCDNIDISTKKYEIEVVTKDGKIYNIVLNNDGSVGYYFNNEYYLSRPNNISVLYFDSVLKENGTCYYMKSDNLVYGIGASYDIWNKIFHVEETSSPLSIDYTASAETDGEVFLDIYYGFYGTMPSATSSWYPKNWEISITIISESEDKNEIKENIYNESIASLPKNQASCVFVNGRTVYGKSFTISIDIDKYILINDSFKKGKIKIEISCDYNDRTSCETYLLYQVNSDRVELYENRDHE